MKTDASWCIEKGSCNGYIVRLLRHEKMINWNESYGGFPPFTIFTTCKVCPSTRIPCILPLSLLSLQFRLHCKCVIICLGCTTHPVFHFLKMTQLCCITSFTLFIAQGCLYANLFLLDILSEGKASVILRDDWPACVDWHLSDSILLSLLFSVQALLPNYEDAVKDKPPPYSAE